MDYRGKAKAVADEIVKAFETGEVPRALAVSFIYRGHDQPCRAWSPNNQLLVALHGHADARGFRQWQKVGRKVKKGEKAFGILGPLATKAKKDDPERNIKKGDLLVLGFKRIPVFGFSQTEGDPLPGHEAEAEFLDSLPLVSVARAWEIQLSTFNGSGSPRLGFYCYRNEGDQAVAQAIGLGVENLSTWAHELVHAADNRRKTLTQGLGQHLDNEVVAELGGAVLLECIGEPVASDRGGAWDYIARYAREHDEEPISVCTGLLDRVVAAVALILDTATEVEPEAVGDESPEPELEPDKSKRVYTADWEGVSLEITHEPYWIRPGRFETDHIELQVTDPDRAVPLTETGYRSHFAPSKQVTEAGGPVALMQALLDEAAAKPAWRKGETARRQMALF